ncbi:hypothetical protein EG329_005459 [Mollisiaceae sp. DMI_Dod_QoI]|nr:hypothetical protein EG329_005459 [Helotiales sp. DMI_Dod_QoI]
MNSPDSAFSDTVATCKTCLDLNSTYLKRQPRSMRGGTYTGPYNIRITSLDASVQNGECEGCQLVQKAVRNIVGNFELRFPHFELEFVEEEGLEGLVVTMNMYHPSETSGDEGRRALGDEELTVVHRSGTRGEVDAEFEIRSPRYEIFEDESRRAEGLEGENLMVEERPASYKDIERNTSGRNPCDRLSEWSAIKTRPNRSRDTGSDAAVEWTLRQLQNCRSRHASCRKNAMALPTRVLDVGEEAQDTVGSVRLYTSRQEEAEYVSLSHCWGSIRPLITTISTMASFQNEIPWNKLPQTFRDAVIFTRKLGIRYLWIDSLCIIQDSEEDWSIEVGKMSSVYENAVLTIAAASSADGNGGLFRRESQRSPSYQLNDTIAMRPAAHRKMRDYSSVGTYNEEIVLPLFRRAWVYQERLLSRRVLVFAPLELIWECSQGQISESGHETTTSTLHIEPGHDRNLNASIDSSPESISDYWHQVVERFTSLNLTHDKDTLPAMAGIAKRVQRDFNCDYYAGLWQKTFIWDLLWETKRNLLPRESQISFWRREHSWNAPSWSWAATSAPKSYEYQAGASIAQFCDVVEVKCEHNAKDPFLEVHSGYAKLEGFLIPLKASGWGSIQIMPHPMGTSYNGHPDYDWSLPGADQISEGDNLYAFPLLAFPQVASLQHNADIHSLILKQCDSETKTFQRVGMCHLPLFELGTYQYIIEGKGMLISALESQIRYAEAILGEDGKYRRYWELRNSDESFKSGLTDEVDRKIRPLDYENEAFSMHLASEREDDSTSLSFDEFYGADHLGLLKKKLAAEKERVKRWEDGKVDEIQQRVVATII